MATARKTAPTTATASRKRAAPQAAAPAAAAAKAPRAAGKAKPAQTTRVPSVVAGGGKPADKPRKPKLVRDSFTIPKVEYTVLEDLKVRAGRLGRPTKKSEVLRAGLIALAAMPDADFIASVAKVPALKTGRPAKE